MTVDSALLRSLVDTVGEAHVLTGDEDRTFYSQDIYSASETPVAVVVRPASREEVAAVVGTATAAGYSVIGRGGATSYTAGLLPERASSVMIDTGRLDQVIEINADDMYVVVEAGCTWKKMHDTLKPHGLRPPFWGPLSGGTATIGGSLSQNSVLLGSALHGASPESVLGLEVVLADGSLVPTGSGSTNGGKPFFRHYGPDLTGLFLGDGGAFGVKVRAVLRLHRTPPAARYVSYSFSEHREIAEAMAEIARSRLASMVFGMDPILQHQRMKRTSLSQDMKALKGVVSAASNLGSGLKEAAKVVTAGRGFLEEHGHSAHFAIEAEDEREADRKLAELQRICSRGREVENSLPKVLHADPFMPMTSAIGPQGERWAPVHGIVPVSDAPETYERVGALFDSHREEMDRCGVVVGFLLSTVANNGFVIEPVFYWPGPRPSYYDRVLEPSYIAKLKTFERNPETDALVATLRTKFIELMGGCGAVHLQIGKTYPYRAHRDASTWQLLEAIKSAVDPQRLMNPKCLGLE
jgi:FAD/FMN-containing dehydrogenase